MVPTELPEQRCLTELVCACQNRLKIALNVLSASKKPSKVPSKNQVLGSWVFDQSRLSKSFLNVLASRSSYKIMQDQR